MDQSLIPEDPKVMTGGSFVCRSPLTHLRWWTCVPVLPRSRDDLGYITLRRQWIDHTMNTFETISGGFKPRGRGFYTETHEDHLATFLFHIFAMFEGAAWSGRLLDVLQVPYEGDIQ